MSTLESQYQGYLTENPHSKYSYEEWLEFVFKQRIDSFLDQMEDIKDWDVTLLDGLEDLPYEE